MTKKDPAGSQSCRWRLQHFQKFWKSHNLIQKVIMWNLSIYYILFTITIIRFPWSLDKKQTRRSVTPNSILEIRRGWNWNILLIVWRGNEKMFHYRSHSAWSDNALSAQYLLTTIQYSSVIRLSLITNIPYICFFICLFLTNLKTVSQSKMRN